MNMQDPKYQQKSSIPICSPEQNYLFIFAMRYPVKERRLFQIVQICTLTVHNPFLLSNEKSNTVFLTFKGSFNFLVDRQVITEIIQLVSSCQFQIFDFVRKESFIILRGRSQTTLANFCPFLTTYLLLVDSFEGIPDRGKYAYR